MNLKKYLVSFVFVILFAGYAALQYLNNSAATYTATSSSAPAQQVADTTSAPQSAPLPQPTQTGTTPVAQVPTPVQTTPTPTPTPAPQPQGQYVDGIYTGDPEDAYYGTVQVQVTVSEGEIADVEFLQYPNDRSTSRYINDQAMPVLKQEAIQAQSPNVSGVSGASDTSGAFRQSLASALAQANS